MTSMRTALLVGATVALGPCSQKFQQPRIDDMTAVQPNGGTTANTGGEIRGQISTHDQGRDH